MSKLKVVVIGGGNGSSITTQALKQNIKLFDFSTVVTMSDSGGSSGRLREEFKTLPPGDILRAVLAMSVYDYEILRKIFNKTRFNSVGKLDGHNLGNLFLVLAEQYGGEYIQVIRALEQAVEAVGRVYPVSLDKTDLVVELDNGKIVKKEGTIDRPDYNKNLKIKRAWLEPEAKIYEEAGRVIKKADYIIIGPGSLYCSIVATLLPVGIKKAIEKSDLEKDTKEFLIGIADYIVNREV